MYGRYLKRKIKSDPEAEKVKILNKNKSAIIETEKNHEETDLCNGTVVSLLQNGDKVAQYPYE